MKKICSIAIGLVLSVTLFAAPKKTIDDWVNEVETAIGPVEWSFKQNLSKAKTASLEKFYCAKYNPKNIPITIANPMTSKDNIVQTTYYPISDVGASTGRATFADLSKGEIFATYEGEYKNISHLWVLKNKSVFEGCVRLSSNGGITITNSSAPLIKYRGWSAGDYGSSAGKGFLQGATFWSDNIGYYTISNAATGEFSILLLDCNAKSVTEYQLLYLGSSSQVSFIKNSFDKKYPDGKAGEFQVKETKSNNMYMYSLTSSKNCLAAYNGLSIFSV